MAEERVRRAEEFCREVLSRIEDCLEFLEKYLIKPERRALAEIRAVWRQKYYPEHVIIELFKKYLELLNARRDLRRCALRYFEEKREII